MANARTHYDYLAAYLQRRHAGVRSGTFIGRLALLLDGAPFMVLYRDSVAFRLAGRSLVHALGLPGATGFDPWKPDEPPPGKPGWVLVPPRHWMSWDRCALDAIRVLELTRSRQVSWKPPPAPPAPPPAPPASTPQSLAARVARAMKSGFSFGLLKSDD